MFVLFGSYKGQLAVVMERHGIEWEEKAPHDNHLSVLDYKKKQRVKEIAALEKRGRQSNRSSG
ncbi:MAG: hypothetical protein KH009_04490 [Clostridiales bacterium]|nr:hypothetical protein [Clostridiales bacterium]